MTRLPLECSVCHKPLTPIETFGLPQQPLCSTHYLPPLDDDPRAVEIQQEIDRLRQDYEEYETQKDYYEGRMERVEQEIERLEVQRRSLSSVPQLPPLAVKLIIEGAPR